MELARSPGGKKLIRYTMVSVVAICVSQVCLLFLLGIFHWRARSANIAAVCISAVPSYYLNRSWVWKKGGRSHLLKEVAPFWALALIGLGFSTWSADFAESIAIDNHLSHVAKTAVIMIGSLAAFGVLWLAKFMIFNELMFKHHPDDLEPALDGRTGLPT
jgi:putative flippase GtrA